MDATTQEKRSACVPEVMEAYFRQSGSREERLEGTLDKVLGVDRRTDTRGEDQTVVLK